MYVGSVVIQPENEFQLMAVAKPAVTSSGAVSPITRAMASVTPEAIPEIAVGMTTFRMVRHLRTPRA